MTTLRFGLIGAGAIARHSIRELAQHRSVEILAVADPNAERLAAFASAHAIPRVYADPVDLLADADVDAVYIAVPNLHHAPMARLALSAGKHTLLDKPFALDFAAASSVAELARRSDKVFMVGMNHRFERLAQKAKRLVTSGRLGDVYHIKAFWRRRSGIPRIGSWFGDRSIAGGGALLDIGVHMLDLALHLTDNFRPVSVTGATYTRFGNRGLGDGAWGDSERDRAVFDVEDFATAMIRLEGGLTVSLDAVWAAHQESMNERDLIIYGTDAGLAVYSDRLFTSRAGSRELLTVQSPDAGTLPFPHASRFHHFVDVALGLEAPIITLDQTLAVQKVLDAIYESARTSREVRFESDTRPSDTAADDRPAVFSS